MMCPTRKFVRSFLSGLLLMGVSLAGVSQAGATATGFAVIEAGLSITPADGVSQPGAATGNGLVFQETNGSGGIDIVDYEASGGTWSASAAAIASVFSGPTSGFAFGLGVGDGTTSVYNDNDSGVDLDVTVGYSWLIAGEATTPKDSAAAGVGLFVVISPYGSIMDMSGITSDFGSVETLDLEGVEIIPLFGALDFTSPDFEYGSGDELSGTLHLNAWESVNVSLVALAGAEANTVPEPASVVLFGSGLVGLVAWRMKKKSTV